MTTFTRRSLLSASALAVLGSAACNGTAVQKADQSASAQASATIGLTYIPNIQFAPFYWAADKGLFGQQGVAVSLRHHGASEGLFTALGAGQEEFVIAGADEVLQANAEGLDLVTVAGYYQTYPVVLIVPEASPIKALKDLEGHSIGVPGEYGESWFGLQLALRNAKLSRKDVSVKSIGYTQQAALATGKVDAIVGFRNNDVVQFAQAGVKVRQIPLGDEIPLVSSSIVTTRKLVQDQPDLVRSVCRAIVQGVQAVVADPSAAVATSSAHIPGLTAAETQTRARATLEATIPLWKGPEVVPRLELDADRFVAMEAFMRSAGLLTKKVDAAKAVDTSVLS
ncbi:NitT/TauT family transport system substrate-binding protein [Luteococcus japonicus]|uniref:NitT/TauT family transport system substrate-binding protein n=1 Tax=Luteococcus japonicus TaxID=33984 RepID=A0A3N1ZQV1_9ACTN|nr:ABC transporter substrate-binding protein [Luteococcus japonicus]ROR53264.1 NitT/TauT family transport system substrate-binding protein [Luteococcus japonicus]